MCTNHFGGDDRWFYRRLFRHNDRVRGACDYSLLGAEPTPRETLDAFRGASAALTMRFHALVFALGCGVPAVVIDYTLGRGKVKALAEKHRTPFTPLDELDPIVLADQLHHALGKPVESELRGATFSTHLQQALHSAGINQDAP